MRCSAGSASAFRARAHSPRSLLALFALVGFCRPRSSRRGAACDIPAVSLGLWRIARGRRPSSARLFAARRSLPRPASMPRRTAGRRRCALTERSATASGWIALGAAGRCCAVAAVRLALLLLDLGMLVLTYVMLGWGLNIVVGLAGLLDLGYVAFYAVGAYSYALLAHYFGLGFWTACRWPASWPRSSAHAGLSRCCGCAATIWPSSRWPSARSSASSASTGCR